MLVVAAPVGGAALLLILKQCCRLQMRLDQATCKEIYGVQLALAALIKNDGCLPQDKSGKLSKPLSSFQCLRQQDFEKVWTNKITIN